MAWSWTKSGRTDDMLFELVNVNASDVKNDRATGKLDCVKAVTITWNTNSSAKVSGQLEVTKRAMLNNRLIRVYYTPTLPGEGAKKILLGTFFAVQQKGHYENGVYSGTIDLVSTLARHTDDQLLEDFVIAKGTSLKAVWKKVFQTRGGWYVWDGVADKKAGSVKVIKRSETPMDVLQYIAKALGAAVDVDVYGRTVIRPYVTPSKRPLAYTIPYGASSVTLPGIDIESNATEVPNRINVLFEYTVEKKSGGKTTLENKKLTKTLSVDSSKSFSRQKCGRYIGKTVDLEELSPRTQARINEVAKTRLATLSSTSTKYTIKTHYLPIKKDDRIRFNYDGIKINGVVEAIDLERLDPESPVYMTFTVRQIGTW